MSTERGNMRDPDCTRFGRSFVDKRSRRLDSLQRLSSSFKDIYTYPRKSPHKPFRLLIMLRRPVPLRGTFHRGKKFSAAVLTRQAGPGHVLFFWDDPITSHEEGRYRTCLFCQSSIDKPSSRYYTEPYSRLRVGYPY